MGKDFSFRTFVHRVILFKYHTEYHGNKDEFEAGRSADHSGRVVFGRAGSWRETLVGSM